MTDLELARWSVATAFVKMMRSDSFSICTITESIAALQVVPDAAALRILRPLHCVRWEDMPPVLREAVPGLIERCLGMKMPAEADAEVQPERRGFLRMLSR